MVKYYSYEEFMTLGRELNNDEIIFFNSSEDAAMFVNVTGGYKNITPFTVATTNNTLTADDVLSLLFMNTII